MKQNVIETHQLFFRPQPQVGKHLKMPWHQYRLTLFPNPIFSALIYCRSEACKIFVGGLASEITEKEFGDYFSQFGIVKDAVVMVDRNTGSSRGFGSVFYCFDLLFFVLYVRGSFCLNRD
ncbi:MAG: hypothetical protein GY765_00465 [bacterium]|nr:hypothetical protein [bacterium]